MLSIFKYYSYLTLPDRDNFPSIFYNLFPDVSIFHRCLRFFYTVKNKGTLEVTNGYSFVPILVRLWVR